MPVVQFLQAFRRVLLQAAVDMLLTADSAVLYSGMPLTVNDMEHFCRIDESTSKVCTGSHPSGTKSAAGLNPIREGE